MNRIHPWLLAAALAVAAPFAFAAPTAPATPAVSEATTLTGTLSILVADDFAHGTARLKYELEFAPGQHVEVHFDGAPPKFLRTGMRVRLQGRFDGQRLVVGREKGAVEVIDGPSAQSLPAPGKRKAVLILTDIVDGTATTHAVSGTCDATDDHTAKLMFAGPGETVDGVYLDSSFGLEGIGGASYPGTALDVVRVLINEAGTLSQVCNPTPWANAADAAATAAGVVLSNYQHRVYVLPPDLGCPWGGLGQLGCGDNCRAWEATYSFYPCGTRGAHAHELGHNRGLMHASTDLDNDGTYDSEYGDTSDFMGSNYDELQHNNGPHKLQMNWIDPDAVVDATAGGTFTVSALELAGAPFPQLLRLGPAVGNAIYVSHRAAVGYDATMPNGSQYLGRTSVHRWNPDGYNNTVYLGSVADGETLGDPTLGLVVKQVSHDSSGAVVQVIEVEPPVLSVSDPVVVEGPSGVTVASFVLTLSAPAPWPVTVYGSTYDGTATAGSDYQAIDTVRTTIPTGGTTGYFDIFVNGDTTVEPDETFELILVGINGATAPDTTATATILDDDVTLSIADVSVAEGDTGSQVVNLTVTLSAVQPTDVTFTASTASSNASPDEDFVPFPSTAFSIPAGQTTATIPVTVFGDTDDEGDELFVVILDNVVGATLTEGYGDVWILNDDGPALSIADLAVAEGNAGTKTLTFTVKLSKPASVPVTYSIATANSSAAAGSDYVARALAGETLAVGQLSRAFAVTLNGDGAVEANESFKVNLTEATGATVLDGQATGTLLNDDGPTLSIADVALAEGASGTKLATFTVALSQAAAVPVTYNIATANGSATAGSDYVAKTLNGQSIPAGTLAKTFTVTLNGDTAAEGNETYTVTLYSAAGATLFDPQATGTILNDDGPTLSITDVQVVEGASGQAKAIFTVSLSQAAAVPVTYSISTANGTATSASGDYVARSLTGETIPAGQLSKTFPVNINGDGVIEANETFTANITTSTGASRFDAQGVATILNDDGATLSIADAAISEGASGLKTLTFTASLSQAVAAPVYFDLATADGTATVANADYVARALAGQNIPAGMTAKTFGVSVRGDVVVETNETFVVNLTKTSGPGTVLDPQATGTITNDD